MESWDQESRASLWGFSQPGQTLCVIQESQGALQGPCVGSDGTEELWDGSSGICGQVGQGVFQDHPGNFLRSGHDRDEVVVQLRCSENWRRDILKEAVTDLMTGWEQRMQERKESVLILGWGWGVWTPVLIHLPLSCSSPQAGEVEL